MVSEWETSRVIVLPVSVLTSKMTKSHWKRCKFQNNSTWSISKSFMNFLWQKFACRRRQEERLRHDHLEEPHWLQQSEWRAQALQCRESWAWWVVVYRLCLMTSKFIFLWQVEKWNFIILIWVNELWFKLLRMRFRQRQKLDGNWIIQWSFPIWQQNHNIVRRRKSIDIHLLWRIQTVGSIRTMTFKLQRNYGLHREPNWTRTLENMPNFNATPQMHVCEFIT